MCVASALSYHDFLVILENCGRPLVRFLDILFKYKETVVHWSGFFLSWGVFGNTERHLGDEPPFGIDFPLFCYILVNQWVVML